MNFEPMSLQFNAFSQRPMEFRMACVHVKVMLYGLLCFHRT